MELRNATEVLTAGPQAPSLARRFVGKALDSWDHSDLRERALLAGTVGRMVREGWSVRGRKVRIGS